MRWFYSTQHYRSKLPFSWDLLEQSAQGYARIKKLVTVLADKLRGQEGIDGFGRRPSFRNGMPYCEPAMKFGFSEPSSPCSLCLCS